MNNAVAYYEQANEDVKKQLVVSYNVDNNKIDLNPKTVMNFIASGKDITVQDYKLFTELCKVRKLNPFLKEVYLIKYSPKQPAQIVVGKDAILKRAILHPEFNGRQQGIIVQKEDGTIEERKGTFKLPEEKLVGGWAKVYRKNWDHETYITVSFDEVSQKKIDYDTKKEVLASSWKDKGATMVEKVALVRALRETFVEDLGGMIDQDEAWIDKEETQPRETKEDIIIQDEPTDFDNDIPQPEPGVFDVEEVNLDAI